MQASLNIYRLDNLNLLIEQARDKGGWIARLIVDLTKKSNTYANEVYTKNQHMHLKPIDALLEIKYKPVGGFSVSNL